MKTERHQDYSEGTLSHTSYAALKIYATLIVLLTWKSSCKVHISMCCLLF